MTCEEYYAVITRRFSWRLSEVPNVYIDTYGDVHSVPPPESMTPEQRLETIEIMKEMLGITG